MVKRCLLSSTLVLGQADAEGYAGIGHRPVFGQPFRFGQPLLFSTPDHSTDNQTAPAGASCNQQLQTDLYNLPSAKHYHASKQGLSLSVDSTAARNTPVPRYQQRRQSSQLSNNASKKNPAGPGFVTASQFYLGSLGAALSYGCATSTARAAAQAVACRTAAQVAAVAVNYAGVPGRQSYQDSMPQVNVAANDIQQVHCAGCTNTADADLPTGSSIATTAAAATLAANLAAAAACHGCAGCKAVLARLQRCSKCCSTPASDRNAPGSQNGSKTIIGQSRAATGAEQNSNSSSGNKSAAACTEDAKQCKDSTPGPGFYTVASSFGRHGVAFSMGAKPPAPADKPADDHPGPGSYYNPRACSVGGPAFSIAGRWKEPGQDVAEPGPGEHQQVTFKTDGPAFTIYSRTGTAAAHTSGNASPGPGCYAADWDRSCNPSGPAYTMGGRVPDPSSKQRSTAPGPAEYQSTDFRPDGPAYSFPTKRKLRQFCTADMTTPAPTDYDTDNYNATRKSAPAYSIAARPGTNADQMSKELLPGPGAYYVSDAGASGPAFSMGGRIADAKEHAEAAQQPAPGDYHRELPKSGQAFSMSGRPASPASKHDDLVGPGLYYNPGAEEAFKNSKAFTIGARLAASERLPGADSPGPASYVLVADAPGPAYTMAGRRVETDASNDSPGPASYGTKPIIPEGPAFSMGARLTQHSAATDMDGPAVGDYDVINTDGMAMECPAWTIGARTARAAEDQCGADSPGPGYYTTELPGTCGPAFSIAGRWPDAQLRPDDSNAGPGPGEYHNTGCSGQSGPAYTMAGRAETSTEAANTPGPGAYLAVDYAVPSATDAPAFTIGGKPAAAPPKDVGLGPGTFNLPELAKGPAYTMAGRIQTEHNSRPTSPGPAAYAVAEAAAVLTLAAPAWTMGSKLKEKPDVDASQPAPGDYDPSNPAAVAAPAWTIGSKAAETDTSKQQLMPGPGYYTPVDPVKQTPGVAFSLGAKWVEKAAGEGNETPAPGAYNIEAGPCGVAFTIAARTTLPESTSAANPAPGQYYTPTQPGREAPAYTIAERLATSTADAEYQPGPGIYEQPDASAIKAAAPAYTMAGKATAPGTASNASEGPGVGQYDAHLVDVGRSAPAYTIAGKLAVGSKAPDGPACVDYDTEKGLASTEPAAPAYTMGLKLADTSATADPDVPAPGYYHCPATAGAPPNAPAAPAFSLQSKHRKGKSRLKRMLGKLAEIDQLTPGPGEHQPAAGGSIVLSGPAFSFGPAAAGTTATGAADSNNRWDVLNNTTGQQQPKSLAQLQEQLARLLAKQTQKAVSRAKGSAAAAAPAKASMSAAPAAACDKIGEQQQLQRKQAAVVTESSSGDLTNEASAASLAEVRDAVTSALQVNNSKRRTGNKTSGSSAKGGTKTNTRTVDFTSPAPGNHFSPSGSLGHIGPAYTMPGKVRSSSNNVSSIRQAFSQLDDADGPAEVLAAAAVLERLSSVPGVGTYKVERAFPYPEGQIVYKPILKKYSGSGAGADGLVNGNASRHSSDTPSQRTLSGQLSGTRRVSWADKPC